MKIQNNLTYVEIDGIDYPDLKEAKQPKKQIGIWGHRYANYLREFHPALYYSMLCQMTLADYLETVDKHATELYDRLIKEFAEKQGVTEELKAENQMLWVEQMNNIANQVREIIFDELIFTYNKTE
ncbi:MAG: TnpV protein [Eubacterium sp.]|nr:TnpV protein [Eubacterium sp.]